MRDHTRLRAFELADSLALAVYRHTRSFPRDEQFGLTAQLRRGAVSVPSNIVEGCARSTHGDYLRFLDVAFASAREVEYQLSLAARLGYLDPIAHAALAAHAAETGRVLAGLIRALRARHATSVAAMPCPATAASPQKHQA
ncbi:MAG: four helix bundle protein [Deltaproteobacteria bacterium]|nr:four helix bundle protein [Deltaproteobacteria bacterium]